MNDANQKAHWEIVYSTKGEKEVSWFQESPVPSLDLIDMGRPQPGSAIVDIGGGASHLVDVLVERGFENSTGGFVGALSNADPTVRLYAAQALGERRDPAPISALIASCCRSRIR